MAEDSLREQIIVANLDKLKELITIKTFQRVRPAFNDLGNFSGEQFPVIATHAGLPKPVEKVSSREPGRVDLFRSELLISLFCYAMENVDPDTKISDLADDIWAKLYEDVTLEAFGTNPHTNQGLTLGLAISPEVQTGIWDPYIVFRMDCTYTYVHGTGGI